MLFRNPSKNLKFRGPSEIPLRAILSKFILNIVSSSFVQDTKYRIDTELGVKTAKINEASPCSPVACFSKERSPGQ